MSGASRGRTFGASGGERADQTAEKYTAEPGKPGSLALLGPGDHAAPYPSCRAKACDHEANRVHTFRHLFDAASIYRRRAEDHARAAAPLGNSRDTRHLHAGGHNEKTQCAGGSGRTLVPRKNAGNVNSAWTDSIPCTYFVPFCAPRENGARPLSD